MRLVLSVVLTVSLAAAGFAQRGGHGGGGSGRGGGFGGGFSHLGGNLGGMTRGGFSSGFGGSSMRGGFAGGSAFRAPIRGNFGFRGGFRFRGSRFGGFYGYPFYGYGFGYGYAPFWSDYYTRTSYPDMSYATAPYEPYYDAYSQQPVVINEPPPVVINEPPPPPAYEPRRSNGPISYLIAFNDHNIKMALAYWTENHNLRYVTTEHEIKTAPLSSVDRDLSMQLNRERRVTFSLPASGG